MHYQTLFIVLVGILLLEAFALYITWRLNQSEDGTREWAIGGLLMALGGMVTVWSRLVEPEPQLTIPFGLLLIFGSALIATGWAQVWLGIRRFFDHPPLHYSILPLYLAGYCLILLLGIPFGLSESWVAAWFSSSVALFSLLVALELGFPFAMRGLTWRLLGIGFAITALFWGIRALLCFSDPGRKITDTFDALVLYEGIIASVLMTLGMILLTTERLHDSLRHLASIDPLTGLLNRRALHERSRPLAAMARRNNHPLAVVLIDFDFFKDTNDTYGHEVGDLVLHRFAEVARSELREQDVLARYGGEEFLFLLPDTDDIQAMATIERLRLKMESLTIHADERAISTTFSAGICVRQGPEVNIPLMIHDADKALYRAKDGGRNRVELFI